MDSIAMLHSFPAIHSKLDGVTASYSWFFHQLSANATKKVHGFVFIRNGLQQNGSRLLKKLRKFSKGFLRSKKVY